MTQNAIKQNKYNNTVQKEQMINRNRSDLEFMEEQTNKEFKYPVHKYHLSDNIRKYKTKLQSNYKS